MSALDLFCAADDQHRVVLLVDVLEQTLQALHAEQTVALRSEPVARPSMPCLVACTSRALREPWIRELFASQKTLVAICLDDTPLPGPCLRTVDIQTWPARSADGEVEALAVWIYNYAAATAGTSVNADRVQVVEGTVASAERIPVAVGPSAGVAAMSGPSSPGALPSGTSRSAPRRSRTSERRGAIMLMALVVVGFAMLWLGGTDDSPGARQEQALAQEAPDGPGAAAHEAAAEGVAAENPAVVGSAKLGGAKLGGATIGGGTVGSTTGGGAEHGVIGTLDAAPDSLGDTAGLDTDRALSETVPIAPATAGYSDAIAHLCEADTLAAAQAWAAVLNWKQRRRVQHEPCVRELLRRPGFESLESRLDLS